MNKFIKLYYNYGSLGLKKAFSLFELIIVIGISGFLISFIGAGVLNLQTFVRMDNILRKIKSEVMAAQVSARTNFIPRSSTQNLNFRISLGWIVTFLNEGNNVRLIRRSVFIQPFLNSQYDISYLNQDIINFKNMLRTDTGFACEGNNFMFYKLPGNKVNNFASVQPNTNITHNVLCADPNQRASGDYYESIFEGINIDYASTMSNQVISCVDQNTALGRNSIFFGIGYGESIIAGNIRECQIKFISRYMFGQIKGLYISKDIGNIRICTYICSR